MLHITNGSSVALRDTGLQGDVLFWNDVLHEGPVPEGMELEELSRVREQFLGDPGGLAARDGRLRSVTPEEDVVLWFEHDLYDQLQLIQLLDWFCRHPARLSLIAVGEYLGRMTPHQLAALWPSRHAVSETEFTAGAAAWAAFRAPDPRGLLELDTAPLPWLEGALRRHLEQFPSEANGLSRTERQILEAVERGAGDFCAAFTACQQMEERIFMGDSTFCGYLAGLRKGPHPLLDEWAVTAAGREVLAGRADAVRLNGIDRWLGGVHLHGPNAQWRWDGFSLHGPASSAA